MTDPWGDFGPAPVIPIDIRPGVRVSIYGIPHDLTVDEAAKIERVIMALAGSRPGSLYEE